jgi:hypothetical protein
MHIPILLRARRLVIRPFYGISSVLDAQFFTEALLHLLKSRFVCGKKSGRSPLRSRPLYGQILELLGVVEPHNFKIGPLLSHPERAFAFHIPGLLKNIQTNKLRKRQNGPIMRD